ncbi:hypothetical protein IKF67_01800 [Candidatus Saccharibacteria bacterium]|nr:hypothetical protein [Candidatus Saccharibacteria bacterium]
MDYTFNFWLGVIVISVLGTLAHFLYEWSHHNRAVGLFAAVNESTWEHIKLALTATLLWSLYDGFFYGAYTNYFLAKLLSLIILVLVIPALFYSYRSFSKKSILVIDIGIFYIAILLSQLSFYGVLVLSPISHAAQYLSCIGLFVFFGCYMTLTLAPLKNLLFKDPINGRYGFRAHSDIIKKIKKKSKK